MSEIMMTRDVEDKLFLPEIINDLHRNGFVSGGKAQVMLHEWAAELREKARKHYPASHLRRVHADEVGKENW